jgi:magnesium-transporting ATPase (P-type)
VLAVAESVFADDLADDEATAPDASALENLCFRGFLAFRDPARESAAATVKRLREAGVEVVMLTGDHPRTARSIAQDVGLLGAADAGRGVMTGGELARLDDDVMDRRIAGVRVFARVTPTQKVRVVRALQRAGRTVAMVGDGANDAPALRVAEVGVAVGERSAAAARASADIVFADADIETLLDGVIEARAMWLSVRDAVSILLGGNLGEIGFGIVGGLISGRSPLNARQILLVNLMTDVAPAMAVALRRPGANAYAELVHLDTDALLRESLDREIVMRAVSTTLGASWAWGLGRLTGTRARASTIALAALVGSQLGQTMLSRGAGSRVMWTSLGSWALLMGLIQTPGLSHLFGCRPMGPIAWSIALGSSAAATGTAAILAQLERRLTAFIEANQDAPWVEPIRAQVRALRDLLPSELPEAIDAEIVELPG